MEPLGLQARANLLADPEVIKSATFERTTDNEKKAKLLKSHSARLTIGWQAAAPPCQPMVRRKMLFVHC